VDLLALMASILGTRAAVGGITDPTNIADLECWYDATQSTITLGTGANVAEIEDLSGNLEDATQATEGNQPDLLADEFGAGLDGIDFTADHMVCGAVTITPAGTFFAVARADALHTGAMMGGGANVTAQDGVMLRFLNTGGIHLIAGDGSNRDSVDIASAYSAGELVRAIGRWDGTNLNIRVNALTPANLAHTIVGSLGTKSVLLGAALTNNAEDLEGKLAAAGKYSRFITDTEADDLMDYLTTRFPDP
jgi:hypothetical protein